MKNKNILKIATTIIFIFSIILSNLIPAANNVNYVRLPTKLISEYPNTDKINQKGPVVWENGMNFDGLSAAQWDEPGEFDAFCADDFNFEEDTLILDINWIGGYYVQGEPATAEFNWCISFFLDDGTGNSPLGTPYLPSYEGPLCYEWDKIVAEEIESGYYKMSVIIPGGINFSGGEKYWIAIWGEGVYPPQSGWGYHIEPVKLHMGVFGSNYWETPFWTDTQDAFEETMDFCYQLKTEGDPIPDLDCNGTLSWFDVKRNTTVKGNFSIGNTGEPGSLLNWTISSCPNWGNWTFKPPNGTQPLGWISVEVTVISPQDKKENFTGEIIVENVEDPLDFCIIDVTLLTPKEKENNYFTNLLYRLFEQFPFLKLVFDL